MRSPTVRSPTVCSTRAASVEANGGLFERLTATDPQRVRVPMRRYWIDLRRP